MTVSPKSVTRAVLAGPDHTFSPAAGLVLSFVSAEFDGSVAVAVGARKLMAARKSGRPRMNSMAREPTCGTFLVQSISGTDVRALEPLKLKIDVFQAPTSALPPGNTFNGENGTAELVGVSDN
eukprot:scaffold3740_cov108-Isochrysis_galbana.AAC.4